MRTWPQCDCLSQSRAALRFHGELQDTRCAGWELLLERIERAAAQGVEVFVPLQDMSDEEILQIRTLPPSIARLTSVRRFVMYGSHLVRVPPEIGQMVSLEFFEPYTSYCLHWLPYELTRCPCLKHTVISIRALYGNNKTGAPYPELPEGIAQVTSQSLAQLAPELYGHPQLTACSVCNRPLSGAGLYQGWVSHRLGPDVLPLLVTACSTTCLSAARAGRMPPD